MRFYVTLKPFIKITPNSNDSRVLRFIYFIQTCTFTCILVNHASTHVPLLPPDGFLAQRIVSPDSFFCLTRMGGHTDPSGAVSGCRGHPAASARGGSPRGSRNIPPTWREYYCQKRRTSKKKKWMFEMMVYWFRKCVTYSIYTKIIYNDNKCIERLLLYLKIVICQSSGNYEMNESM